MARGRKPTPVSISRTAFRQGPTPCKLLGLFCGLWLVMATPAGAADYLKGDWFIVSGNNKLSTSASGHPPLKDSFRRDEEGAEVTLLVLRAESA
jgi:hypothetical protein